ARQRAEAGGVHQQSGEELQHQRAGALVGIRGEPGPEAALQVAESSVNRSFEFQVSRFQQLLSVPENLETLETCESFFSKPETGNWSIWFFPPHLSVALRRRPGRQPAWQLAHGRASRKRSSCPPGGRTPPTMGLRRARRRCPPSSRGGSCARAPCPSSPTAPHLPGRARQTDPA